MAETKQESGFQPEVLNSTDRVTGGFQPLFADSRKMSNIKQVAKLVKKIEIKEKSVILFFSCFSAFM